MTTPIDPIDQSLVGSPTLRTLLLTDFVSSTALIEQLGDQRASQIFVRHDRMARDLLARHDGAEIDKTDGFLFVFTRPFSAVCFALAYHDMLGTLSDEVSIDLQARVGMHVGEVVLRRNSAEDVERGAKPVEVDGLSKHAAARVMSVALGGQTLLTGATYQLARRGSVGEDDLENVRWVSHGEYFLKGLDMPVPLYEVGREGVAPFVRPPSSEKVHRQSNTRLLNGVSDRNFNFVWKVLALGLLAWGVVELVAPESAPDVSVEGSPASQEVVEVQPLEPPLMMALHIVSQPVGADVSWQDAVVGVTPTTISVPLLEGAHRVTVALDGHQQTTMDCVISSEDVAQGSGVCSATLVEQPGQPALTPVVSEVVPPAPQLVEETEPSVEMPDGYKESPF